MQAAPPVRERVAFGWVQDTPLGRFWVRLPFWVRTVLLGIVASSIVPLYGDNYVTSVAIGTATFAMLGLGLNIVAGYAGLLDLGYAAFFAIGAYSAALLW